MDLLEIREWLHQVINDELPADRVKNDPILEKISQASYSFLEEENQKYEYPYDDYFDMFKGLGDTYERKTIAGYFYSWQYSSEIKQSSDSEVINQRVIEWWDYLENEMGEDDQHYRYALNIYLHLMGGDVPLSIYDWSRKEFYNEMVDFIDGYYDQPVKTQKQMTEIHSRIAKAFLNNINWLDKKIGLDRAFPKTKGWWWPHFWRVKLMIENIDRDLNRGSGGPDPKIIKTLKGVDDAVISTIFGWADLTKRQKNNLPKYAEFCQDLNIHIENNECVSDKLINTWELAGIIMEKEKYSFLDDRDGLNKFIKSCFETRWLKFESEYNLVPIVEFDSKYYTYITE